MRAHDLVTTGATTHVFGAKQGDEIEAGFDGVGSVSVRFDGGVEVQVGVNRDLTVPRQLA